MNLYDHKCLSQVNIHYPKDNKILISQHQPQHNNASRNIDSFLIIWIVSDQCVVGKSYYENMLLNKSEGQKQSGCTVSCTGENNLRQNRCHQNCRKMHSTQGVLQLWMNNLMLIISNSCTTQKYSSCQEGVCLIFFLN